MPDATPTVRELLKFHFECLQGMYFSAFTDTANGPLLFSDRISDPYYNFLSPTKPDTSIEEYAEEFTHRNRQPAVYLTPLAGQGQDGFAGLTAWANDAWLTGPADALSADVPAIPGLAVASVEAPDREKYVDTFSLAYSGDDPDDPYGQLDPAYAKCLLDSFDSQPDGYRKYYVLATLEDSPVGIAAMFTQGTLAGVYGVGTVPAYRGRGIGAAIMAYLAKAAAEDGVSHIMLQTEAQSPVQRWYEKLGYHHVFTAPYLVRRAETDS